MELEELLSQQFDVSDALDPSRRALLASACQPLDMAPARASLGAAEAARVDAERNKALRQALASTGELIASSRFDLQVLAVLMRLNVEVKGLEGVRAALSMIVKLLDQSWATLSGSARTSPERDKLDRRRGSYLDAVFAQIYFWLARERERSAAALAQAIARDRDGWLALLDAVDDSLARSSAKVSRWQATRQALEACLLSSAASPSQRAPAAEVAPAEVAPAEVAAAEVAAVEVAAVEVAAPAVSEAAPSSAAPLDAAGPTALLEVSPRFRELERRLAAFGKLLEAGETEKARIVARDLSQTLEHFDVAAYFPGLFAGYFALSARYAQALSGSAQLDAVRGSALAELYRTDLTRFLQLALDRHG